MDPEFARRYVNDGFSGGEMKRAEILQMAMLRPKFAILDETDSGLDVDAVRLASQSIAEIGRRGDGHPDHHAPRTTAGTQSARLHARDAGRPDRRDRRAGAGRRIAQARLRPHPRRPIPRRPPTKQRWKNRGSRSGRTRSEVVERLRHDQSRRKRSIMATDTDPHRTIDRRNQQVRFSHRRRKYVFKARKGLDAEIVARSPR